MRRSILLPMLMIAGACGNSTGLEKAVQVPQEAVPDDTVSVDFDMAEAGVDWIELVAAGADDAVLREQFFREVAPTAGCQAIIRHWERFRDWDEEIFYDFILEALDRKVTDAPLVTDDGQPTRLGHARRLWTAAVADVDRLRANLEELRAHDVRQAALEKARRYLPPEADVSSRFHVVVFGASGAFSVGDENGFDLLQLKRRPDGEIDVQWLIDLFAHEMHHSGFKSATKQHLGEIVDDDRIQLAGVLVAEGMATYFTTPPFDQLEKWRTSDDPTERGLAADWDSHIANMPSIYRQAETDIAAGLDGKFTTEDLMTRWLGGMQGPAYGLGVDMVRLIDHQLGTDVAISLARDPRRLLNTYNSAAARARDRGEDAYLFDAVLAERLERFDPVNETPG
jgi:hypothetical protein